MLSKQQVKQLQEILMNSWPAKHYYFLNGWILRFTKGVTARANSVLPLHYNGDISTLEKDIKLAEKAYHSYNLPAIFTIHDFFEPSHLDDKLFEMGYQQLGCITNTMVAPIPNLKTGEINDKYIYNYIFNRMKEFSDFLAKFSKRDDEAQQILKELNHRIIIPKKCFIVARDKKKIIGTLMGVLDPRGFLYIADVLVHPDHRRNGLATSMFFKVIKDWALPNGAEIVWLQVEADNDKALNLYQKLGMKTAYKYYYLEIK